MEAPAQQVLNDPFLFGHILDWQAKLLHRERYWWLTMELKMVAEARSSYKPFDSPAARTEYVRPYFRVTYGHHGHDIALLRRGYRDVLKRINGSDADSDSDSDESSYMSESDDNESDLEAGLSDVEVADHAPFA